MRSVPLWPVHCKWHHRGTQSRNGSPFLRHAGSHPADGIGRTGAGTAVCHPSTEAYYGTAADEARYPHRDPVVPSPQRHRRQ